MLPDLHSSVSDPTKYTFNATYWIFHFESVTRCASSNDIIFGRIYITGTFPVGLGWFTLYQRQTMNGIKNGEKKEMVNHTVP